MPTTLGPLTDFPIDKPTPVTIDGDTYSLCEMKELDTVDDDPGLTMPLLDPKTSRPGERIT